MTVWKNPDRKKMNDYVPRRHDFSKQFWRECPAAFLNDNEGRQPGIISWMKYLEEEGMVENPCVDVRIVCVQYGDKDFFVSNVFSDSLQMHVSLMADMNFEWREMVLNSIEFCDNVSKKVWLLAKDINLASGGSNSTKESKGTAAFFAESVKADYYNRMDRPFRKWLYEINPEMDNAEEEKVKWERECVHMARRLGNELMRQVDTAAIFGRTKAGSDDRKSETYSAASAMNWFLIGLNTIENS